MVRSPRHIETMTRKSKREIERAIENHQGKTNGDTPLTVVIQRDRIDSTGEVVETVKEDVIEI